MSTTGEQTPVPLNPNPPKIPVGDPRLRVQSRARTLKKWPVLAVAGVLVGAVALALVFALEPAKGVETKSNTDAEVTQPVVVPEQIRVPAKVHPEPDPNSEYEHSPSLDTDSPSDRRPAHLAYASSDPYDDLGRRRQAWIEQDWKAQNAGVLFESGASNTGAAQSPSAAPPEPHPAPAATRGAAHEDNTNGQDRKNEFLRSGSGNEDLHSVQRTRSRDQVLAGSIIPVVLITGINSDLPGPVIGQVRESVYDTASGNDLLIPQGSKLIATYDSMIAWGQERVLLCWSRLLFPNGSSLDLECMPAADLLGSAGFSDEVDEHWWRILKGASIASLLSATTQSVAGNTQGFNPTLAQTWARNSAEEVNNTGQKITQRNLNIQPTITIRPGFSVNLIVTKDLTIAPYSNGERIEDTP